MILLIGGLSHTGKTYLASQLMQAHHLPYISMDHIKMGMIRGMDACGFLAKDEDEVITSKLWPILKGIIMSAIENKQSLIMEGCYLPLNHLEAFPAAYHKHIRSFYIGFSTNYIQHHFADIIAYEHVMEERLFPYQETQDALIKAHRANKELLAQAHQTYFEINANYQEEMKEILQTIKEWIAYQ